MFQKKILVLGGSGTIGHAIISSVAQFKSNISYTSVSRLIDSNSIPRTELDLTKPICFDDFFALENDVIVFAAGLDASDLSNQKGLLFMENERSLLTRALEMGKKVIYFSSSRVAQFLESGSDFFDTQMMNYIEHKIEIERICGNFETATVIRPGKVISKNLSLYRVWGEKLAVGDSISVSSKVMCNPVHILDLTEVAVRCIIENHPGLHEVWCFDQLSYLDIAKLFFNKIALESEFEVFFHDTNLSIPGITRRPNMNEANSWMKLAWESSAGVFQNTLDEYLSLP